MTSVLAQRITTTAEQLDVSPRTIRRMIERGELEAVRVGRQLRVLTSSIDRFTASPEFHADHAKDAA